MASRVYSLNGVKHSTISVSSLPASPVFYGGYTESPTQFLLCVQEYAQLVHSWDLATLVNGMSHFLRDSLRIVLSVTIIAPSTTNLDRVYGSISRAL